MNIKSILKNLFHTKKELSHALVNLNDILKIPKRSDFSNYPDKLKKIDKYKKEYLSSLKQNKTITSTNLMPTDLHEDKNIYIDLLLNLCTENTTDVSFESINEINKHETSNLDILTTIIKLSLYQQEVSNLENETYLRLIALNEIATEIASGKIFTKLKAFERTKPLLAEINNLQSALIILTNQRIAMKTEAETYLSNLNITDYENLEIDNNEITNKLTELKNIITLLSKEYLEDLENLNPDPKYFIAKLEQFIEIYVYKHPKTIENIKQELKNITYELKSINDFENNEDTRKIKEKYLKQINKLETLYKIYSQYKRKSIYKKDLENLYAVKFRILTLDINENKYFTIPQNATFTEIDCYIDIIAKKIENILNEKNPNIKEHPNFTKTALTRLILKILKNGKKQFTMWNILNDRKTLAFLLSLDTPDGLTKFFNNFVYSKSELNDLDFYEPYINWNDELSLDTIYRLKTCNSIPNSHTKKPKDYLFSLYNLMKKTTPQEQYKLPEGIKEINIPRTETPEKLKQLLQYIKELANKKDIIMPSSLRILNGNLFDEKSNTKIILNEGILKLGDNALDNTNIEHIVLPSTLTNLSKLCINDWTRVKSITINTPLTESLIEDLKNILSNCFTARNSGKSRYYHVSEEDKRKQKMYNTGKYTSSDHSFLYKHDTIYDFYQIAPTFKEIIFITEEGEYTFDEEYFSFIMERNEIYIYKFKNAYALTPKEEAFIEEKIDSMFHIIEENKKKRRQK